MTAMRYLSVCSGMEAASVAWEPLGWTPVAFSEIEPFPSAILKHRFPKTPNYGNLLEYKSWPIDPGSIDLLVGGTPCQSFSVAGLRKGLDDPRGNLALVFLGLVDRLQPKWVVWENVPGVLSSNGGRDFGSLLGALVKLGYGFAYRVLDAQFVGRCRMHSQGQGWDVVPQRRRRVFVVACRGPRGWADAAKVFFKPESLSWHPPSRSKKGKNIADDAQVSPGGKSKFLWSASDQPNAERYIDKAGTLNCNNRQRGGYIVPTVIDRAAFNQVENAQYEPHIEQTDIMDSLVAKGPHAVGVPFIKPIAFDTYNQSVANTNQAIGSSASDVNHYGAVLTPDEPMVVRRLTPRETERLQGFPDDWSMIPWKGKSADQCPDGPRYRACGNSMAVPVMRYIGGKIDQVERESK